MRLLFFLAMMFTSGIAVSQQVLPLYEGPIPNSLPVADRETSEMRNDGIFAVYQVSRPTLTVYLPEQDKATGDAIIVCPGGGYGMLAAGHEGEDVARKLNELGIAAFVLKYRLPNKEWMVNPEIGPVQDAQQAILMVRKMARKWKFHRKRIGILGFSAGAHLASTASTHFDQYFLPGRKKGNVRPDFTVLIYPVISFSDSIGHIGSRENLLGKNASPEKIREYSNELRVTKNTPPAFLVHAKDDPVNVKNTYAFAAALKAHKVRHDTLIFEHGGHGFGLVNSTSSIQWIEEMQRWLKSW